MTKGELIANCLMLLNENDGEEIDAEMVSGLPEYKERTSVIVPSINRALNRLAVMKKLPIKTVVEKAPSENYGDIVLVKIDDLLSIANIFKYRTITKYEEIETDYVLNSNIVQLPSFIYEDEQYKVMYHPKALRLKISDLDTMEINYPEDILDCVPYFVKADLFEEDNPSLAVLARNTFEQYAEELPTQKVVYSQSPIDYYGLY